MLSSFTWFLVIELRSSCLYTKHFTDSTITQVLLIVYFKDTQHMNKTCHKSHVLNIDARSSLLWK